MSSGPCLPRPSIKDQNKLQSSRTVAAAKSNSTSIDELQNMTAEQYLASVALESRGVNFDKLSLSSLSSLHEQQQQQHPPPPSNNNYHHDSQQQKVSSSIHYLLSIDLDRPISSRLPTKEQTTNHNMDDFIQSVMRDFSELRMYLDQCRDGGVGSRMNNNICIPLPPLKDEIGWHEFCLGKFVADGNPGGYFDDDDHDDSILLSQVKTKPSVLCSSMNNNNNNDDCTAGWKESMIRANTYDEVGTAPVVKLLLQMDQVMVRRVLGHHLSFLEQGWAFSFERAQWIYALLAALP